MPCGCKGSSYESPANQQQSQKAAKQPRKQTVIDESYYHRPVYNGPQPKQSKQA